ncbi:MULTISPECIES: DUF6314 family protein [Falsihalocynthiibacter]|uniref:DUF6314 family protein n=1 Tax=Falsihalocynthiibacter TaxID=2854182 RepID=UPI003002EA97
MSFSPDLMDFSGEWALERDIQSEIAGQAGRFSGRAWFCAAEGGLAYREVGKLHLGAAVLQAERRYFWREAAGEIEVLFADGRPFHSFTPAQTVATHFCDPDVYQVAYDFSKWPQWSSRWRVSGPRKDYVMTSRFSPVLRPEPS